MAAWAIRRPVAVVMLALAVAVPGLFAVFGLRTDLLPPIIYPSIAVRVNDPGVPARIMEDQVTRQLEEQLAITEGASGIESHTRRGRSAVDLFFPYGTDIDEALRDASTRLDRAKRFLPNSIDPPIIYKRDPSQAPVMELVVSSRHLPLSELLGWTDYRLARRLVNLPGVAAAEVGGGAPEEVWAELDPERLAAAGLSYADVSNAIEEHNQDAAAGRIVTGGRELSSRVFGRARALDALRAIPLRKRPEAQPDAQGPGRALTLGDVARVRLSPGREALRIRLNGTPGVKVSIQKQPQANTVAVVDRVHAQLDRMREQGLMPADVEIRRVNDQAVFIRHALDNAASAAGMGATLAMLVVYLFLGDLRRTLVVGTAIPLALLVTFLLMKLTGLTLNLMTLGGLALGVGLLVDSTIVMLENIQRHQRRGEPDLEAATHAAQEVTSPIVASTTTNLAAVLPFLFISGLTGLLFRELIFTLAASIAASMLVALTLVPSLAARIRERHSTGLRRIADRLTAMLQRAYGGLTERLIRVPWLAPLVLAPALGWAGYTLSVKDFVFLPPVDEGQALIRLKGDPGMELERMDRAAAALEERLLRRPEVDTLFTQVGGWVYGRTQWLSSNRASIAVQLVPRNERDVDTAAWVERVLAEDIEPMAEPGIRITARVRGRVRGLRIGRGEDDLNLRIAGPDLAELARLGDRVVERLRSIEGVRHVGHTYQNLDEELKIHLDPVRAARLGIHAADVARALRIALDGVVATAFYRQDRRLDVRLRLPEGYVDHLDALHDVIVEVRDGTPIRVRDVAQLEIASSPATIYRDRQTRTVEISAALTGERSLAEVAADARAALAGLELPPGYVLYDDGALDKQAEARHLARLLLGLALFLVFVVMAVQYESLRNPLVILLSVPFALIGVMLGLQVQALPLSMPVWLGVIMLAGIVVNNAIVLVEQVEIERESGRTMTDALARAARHRLRPILMTTLTTVVGMLPLALGHGEGAEMLQPLAVVIVWGLSFSMLVSLWLVPSVYRLLHHATTLNIKGESSRLKDKRKVGLITRSFEKPEDKEDE